MKQGTDICREKRETVELDTIMRKDLQLRYVEEKKKEHYNEMIKEIGMSNQNRMYKKFYKIAK